MDWQAQLGAIPAPPFGEQARSEWLAARFAEAGLSRVETDAVGNVLGWLPAANLPPESTGPVVVLSAHLDTVFPAGTPLNGIGFFNSYFTGQDVYNNWHGMYALFSSINANAFLNRVVVYVMPGEGIELGERISVDEARRRRPALCLAPQSGSSRRTQESPGAEAPGAGSRAPEECGPGRRWRGAERTPAPCRHLPLR